MQLSVLDLSPISSGVTAGETLWRSVDLAEHAEACGYVRYWLAEHHNAASVASSAPEILIGQIAARTRKMRVGSGGIMLPNHSPLKVAELFRVLAAMFPGRIDLGLGRAAGTDPRTGRELRRGKAVTDGDEFAAELEVLEGYLRQDGPYRSPFAGTTVAIPRTAERPSLWLLGSSDYSSALAAKKGLGFAFARHMNPDDAAQELAKYRSSFQSQGELRPHAIVSVAVVCAETDAEARRLASSAELSWIRFAQGRRDEPLPSVEEALAHEDDEHDAAIRRMFSARLVVGDPGQVHERLSSIAAECGANEIMILTHVHDHEARKRSYELVGATFERVTHV